MLCHSRCLRKNTFIGKHAQCLQSPLHQVLRTLPVEDRRNGKAMCATLRNYLKSHLATFNSLSEQKVMRLSIILKCVAKWDFPSTDFLLYNSGKQIDMTV